MMKCCVNASSVNVEKCAGSTYFKFVQHFFDSHYYLYDNGCEGIRDGFTENGDPMCKFHKNFEHTERLVNGWRSKPLKRVPPPVPDYSSVDGFHYCNLEQIYNGDVTEKFCVRKDVVCDARRRTRDDFCPRKQLDKLLSSCGEADIIVEENVHDDESISLNCVDRNNTMQKAMAKVDEFVEQISGDDLRNFVETEIKRRHDMKVKAFITKLTKASNKAIEKAKTCNDIDWAKCIKEDYLDKLYVSQLKLYLGHKIGMSKAECDKKGYTKPKKIEDIKADYYTNSNRKSGTINTIKKYLGGMYSLQPITGVHVPPSSQPGHVPPSSQPVHVPTSCQPGHVPASSQPAHVPTSSQLGHIPPSSQHGQVPPSSQPVDVPTSRQPGHVPPSSQPGHVPASSQPAHVPTSSQLGHIPPSSQHGQVPPSSQPVDVPTSRQPGHVPPSSQPVHVPTSSQPVPVPPSSQHGKIPPFSQPVHVPPWGGCFHNQSIMQTQTLVNTCPIDNYLTLFHLLMHDYKNFFNYLLASPDVLAATLVQVKSLFDMKHFEQGKILWLHQFQGRFNLNAPIIDTWGNEDDLFFSQLQPVLCSKYSGKCSPAACPIPFKEYVSPNISLRYVGEFIK